MNDAETEVIPHRSHKDRARWCRGKVGVEHRFEWVVPHNAWGVCKVIGPYQYHKDRLWYGPWWLCRHEWVCAECGKKRDTRRDAAPSCPLNTNHIQRQVLLYWWKSEKGRKTP